jgi:hypothetical protein
VDDVLVRLVVSSFVLLAASLIASTWTSADAADLSGCRTVIVTYPDGSTKALLAPPTPSGTLKRLSNRRFRFTWRFESLPLKCRPKVIALGLKLAPPGTIIPFKRPVTAKSGTYTTFALPGTLASKVIYGRLWAEQAPHGLMSQTRQVPLSS